MTQRGWQALEYEPRTKWLMLWQWLFNLSLLGLFGLLLLNWPRLLLHLSLAEDSSLFRSGWLLLLVTTCLLLLAAATHELGHLLAGFLVRFRFFLLVIGPMRISRANGRFRLRWHRDGSFFNGMAASLPANSDNLARRLLFFALGGPLASLGLTMFSLLLVLWLSRDLSRMLDYLWLWESAIFTAAVSYFLLLTSLKPGAYHNGVVADGGRILMLLSRSSQEKRWQALVLLNAADFSGLRPSAWDQDLLRRAKTPQDNSLDYLMALVMNYHHWLDKNQPRTAEAFLVEALNLPAAWVSGMRARLALEKAYLAAAHFQDLKSAQEWFSQVRHARRTTDPLYWRAWAALLLLEGDMVKFIEVAEESLRVLNGEGETGLHRAEADWIHQLVAKVRDKP